MAHVAVVVDEDPALHDRFATAVSGLFAGLPGAVAGGVRHGPLACLWASGPTAPIDLHRDGDTCALLVGYALDADGRRVTARDLARAWLAPEGAPCAYDGYHLGLAFAPDRGLVVGIDPFGMFPLYHARLPGQAVVAATTPEAIARHPAVVPRIDRGALAGVLLVHGPLADRPLLAGCRRLATGHALRRRPGRPPEEVEVHRSTATPPPPGESADAARARIDHELAAAVRRHRPADEPTSLLLSGGLDSRLVACLLADAGVPTTALVLGDDRDFEVVAGSAVARRLGMPLEVVSTEEHDHDFADRVRRDVGFSHLSCVPNGDDLAEGLARATTTGRWFWSGLAFDWVVEPVSSCDGRDHRTGAWRFDLLLAFLNRWGIPVDQLPGLLGADGAALVHDALARLHAGCHAHPDGPLAGGCRVRWNHRSRNHLATVLHRTTWHSWPLVPTLDRRVVEAIAGLPVECVADRALEIALLAARRPELGDIPRDSNSFVFRSVGRGGSPAGLVGRLAASARKRAARWYWRGLRGHDPRRYARLFDVDHPRWRTARRTAEPLRPRLHGILEPREVDRLLPPAARNVGLRDPINGGGAIRLLLGLAFLLDGSALGSG
jgi:hypothetical protein